MSRHFIAALVAAPFLLLAAAPPAEALPVPSVELGAPSAAAPRSLRASMLLDRERLRAWGIERPSRLAFDDDGALYVLDARARRVVRLSILSRTGEPGSAGGDAPGAGGGDPGVDVALFGDDALGSALPHDIALDLRGSLLVLDRSRAAVGGYDRRASYLGTRDLDPGLAEDARAPGSRLLRDPYGDLWLLASRLRDLVPLDARLLRRRPDRFLTPEDSLREPVAAAFLPKGGGWIADRAAGRLWRFDATGRIRLGATLAAAAVDSSATSPSTPVDLAVDSYGALYVADLDGSRIVILDREGRELQSRWLGGDAREWHPGAIAWSPRDKIAVADESRGEIWIFDVERGEAP